MSLAYSDNWQRVPQKQRGWDRSPETIAVFVKAFTEAFREQYPEEENFTVTFHNDWSVQPKAFHDQRVLWDASAHWNSVEVVTHSGKTYNYMN
jgi:hypothetical protein